MEGKKVNKRSSVQAYTATHLRNREQPILDLIQPLSLLLGAQITLLNRPKDLNLYLRNLELLLHVGEELNGVAASGGELRLGVADSEGEVFDTLVYGKGEAV